MSNKQRIIVGISGASGVIYAVELLKTLRHLGLETHLVVSKPAEIVRAQEIDITPQQLKQLADHYHNIENIAAPIASGSFKTLGMIIAPCSMHTLSEIATSNAGNLLTRAADVVLKERRRLVLLTREVPLHASHIKNMLAVTEMGGIIAPPVPAFYTHPKTIQDIVTQTVGRTLDLFDLDANNFPRWEGDISTPKKANEREENRREESRKEESKRAYSYTGN